MPWVNLPPGNSSLRFADGQPPARAERPGGRVWLSEERARAVDSMGGNGTAGLLTGRPGHHLGTRKGRWCASCRRLWNAWNHDCPKCGQPTGKEGSPDDCFRQV